MAGVPRSTSNNMVNDQDVFPPLRSYASENSAFLPYMPEDIAFEEEYEEYLSDLGITEQITVPKEFETTSDLGTAAWTRLSNLPNMADNISDSESVISIGELAEEGRFEEKETRDENRNDWEVIVTLRTAKRLLTYNKPSF